MSPKHWKKSAKKRAEEMAETGGTGEKRGGKPPPRYQLTKDADIQVCWEIADAQPQRLLVMTSSGDVCTFRGIPKLYYHEMLHRDDARGLLAQLLTMFPDAERKMREPTFRERQRMFAVLLSEIADERDEENAEREAIAEGEPFIARGYPLDMIAELYREILPDDLSGA